MIVSLLMAKLKTVNELTLNVARGREMLDDKAGLSIHVKTTKKVAMWDLMVPALKAIEEATDKTACRHISDDVYANVANILHN